MTKSTSRTLAATAICVWVVAGCSSTGHRPPGAELKAIGEAPTYATPEDAVLALMQAAGSGDSTATAAALGPGAEELSAGTAEETAGDLQRLALAYSRGNELVREADGSVSLLLDVAARRWTFPITIVAENDRWKFDVAGGAQRVVEMRIARNESDAIRLLRALVDAQKKYFDLRLGPNGTPVYASRFFSRSGTRDGLYWPESMGEPVSPVGPIAADAEAAGYDVSKRGDEPQPFQGYWWRILSYQGENAAGGAQNYVDTDGLMTGGFAFLAWPESYGKTGVKSFIVSSDGSVWEQDLGDTTAELADKLEGFDPGSGWQLTTD
ncbi:MAG: DUF2950 family protein [Phycisphaerae bacterium]|nr:DUF2950 family protein [Phycisphaerae bacterium]